MAAVVGNILKVTAFQSFLGQLLQNVHFYRLTSIPTPSEGMTFEEYVANRFNAVVGIPMRAIQSANCQHTIYRVDNVSNNIDFAEVTIDTAGGSSGDPLASFDALNFILRRTTGVTRNGSKRLGGLSEASISGNTNIVGATALANYTAALSAPLVTADATPDPFAEAVIVGRVFDATVGEEGGYVLDLSRINPIASAAYTAVSTQRSRKAGHGT